MTTSPALQHDVGVTRGRTLLHRILHEARQALPPTLFFFAGFNLIVLTTNLLVPGDEAVVGNFMLATFAALVVGKAVLVANAIPWIRTFDRAPLLQPILFKTAFYWIIVFLARLLERFVRFAVLEGNPPGEFARYLASTFSWDRFIAISLWVLVLFLIYVTAREFGALFGAGEIRRLMFTARPSNLQLGRRQRARELLRVGRIADAHTIEELRDPSSAAHRELDAIFARLARPPRPAG